MGFEVVLFRGIFLDLEVLVLEAFDVGLEVDFFKVGVLDTRLEMIGWRL